jgi:3-methyl-2-oxobutanoate hydroxymethyltransferase
MGHLGLTPYLYINLVHTLQCAKEKKKIYELIEDAKITERLGCFCTNFRKRYPHILQEKVAKSTNSCN